MHLKMRKRLRHLARENGRGKLVELPLEFEGERAFVIWDWAVLGRQQFKARIEIDPERRDSIGVWDGGEFTDGSGTGCLTGPAFALGHGDNASGALLYRIADRLTLIRRNQFGVFLDARRFAALSRSAFCHALKPPKDRFNCYSIT